MTATLDRYPVTETEETPALPAGDRILGPDGPISREFAGYEPRRPQIAMCNLCEEVIGNNGSALIEAGTGTGKSYAYLIAAILSGKRVVISTDTIQLQQQLVDSDLPFLSRLLEREIGRPIKFAIAKGRANFFCERNAEGYAKDYAQLDRLGALDAEACLIDFRDARWDGDKATLRMAMPEGRWGVLCGDESCVGKQCPHARMCAYLRAKEKYEDADIVVTNHAMYLLHHYVLERTSGTAGILPEHSVWIADEAHTISDKAVDTFGIEVSHRTVPAYLKRVTRQAKLLGLDLGGLDLQAPGRAAEQFFSVFHGAPKDELLLSDFPSEVIELAKERLEALVNTLKPIRLAIYWAGKDVDPQDYEKRGALDRLYQAASALVDNLKSVFEPNLSCDLCAGTGEDTDFETVPGACHKCGGTGLVPDNDSVAYAEISGNPMGGRDVTLHRKPIETAPIFKRILSRLESVIFTSATLDTGKGSGAWRPVADDLGLFLPDVKTMQVESPFDYPKQVTGYVPPTLPESRSPEYHSAIVDELVAILTHTQGRAFVLFTARRDLEKVYELLRYRVRFPLLAQGEMPRDELVRKFKETPHAVLLGNKTFWTGVDIPGDALSCVILVKLPFPNVMHPLNAARCERIKKRGGRDFTEFSLPRCIRDVKQGFGRLIRSKSDTGLFAILDPRMRTARYGSEIANALPSFPYKSKLG